MVGLPPLASAQAPESMVLSGETAYLLLPPVAIASGCHYLAWSPSGGYLLAVTTEYPTASMVSSALLGAPTAHSLDESIVVYDVLNRRTTTIWHGALEEPAAAQWISGADKILLSVETFERTTDPAAPRPSLLTASLVDPNSGKSTVVLRLPQHDGSPQFDVQFAPKAPFGIVTLTRSSLPRGVAAGGLQVERDHEFHYLAPDGTLGPTLDGLSDMDGLYGWTPDGKQPIFRRTRRGDHGAIDDRCVIYDLASGKTTPTVRQLVYRSLADAQPLTVEIRRGLLKSPPDQPIATGWLKGADSPEIMFSSDVDPEWAILSPNLTSLAYISRGVAQVRALASAPKKAYLDVLAAAKRQALISQAKQVVLAAIQYASDNDDRYPGKGENIHDLLMPYLQSRSFMEGFTYTFAGGPESGIAEPARTELGYVRGDGGRAIAYLDGHVRWEPDP